MSTVFMFSGQGSQYRQMGRPLLEKDAGFRRRMQELDELVAAELGTSVMEQLYAARAGLPFDDTVLTHPAIFMLEVALAMTLVERGLRPDCVVGSSLGEVAAAVVAGMLTAADAAQFVTAQARLFDRVCAPGGMTAVLGPLALHRQEPALRACELASVNSPNHFVLAGSSAALDHAERALERLDTPYQRLPVSRAFHSSHIDAAEAQFRQLAARLRPSAPRIRFISCTSGEVGPGELDPGRFWEVVRRPTVITDAFALLEHDGPHRYIDAGPGGSMANFAKRCLSAGSGSTTVSIFSPFDNSTRGFDLALSASSATPAPHQQKGVMNESKVFMFPGQGSQYRGMGSGLFERYPDLTASADDILGYSIKRLCLEDPDNLLGKTEYTQPALYVASAMQYLRSSAEDGPPAYALGHSLGEYGALFAAGAFDFATGLRMVKRRGQLMGAVSGGGMMAVLNLDPAILARVLEENGIRSIDLANFNAPGQVVIAGPSEELARATGLLEKAGGFCVPLNVSAPFHSRYMEPVRAAFADYLGQFQFQPLAIPVISNVDAVPYAQADIALNLERQVAGSVRWAESIWYLLRLGLSRFEEIGPGEVLTKMLAKIQRAGVPPLPDAPPPRQAPAAPAVRAAVAGAAAVDAAQPAAAVTAESLGSPLFRQRYGVKHAYAAGAMYKGIASKEMVERLGRAGYLSFFGAGGLKNSVVADALAYLNKRLDAGQPFGVNLVCNLVNPNKEMELVQVFVEHGVRVIEAAAFMNITPALVWYRLRGLRRGADGRVEATHCIIAKVSRPEVAEQFLSPAPERVVAMLLEQGRVTPEQAELARQVPMADDLCVEADSGGHTDMGVAFVLLPTIMRQRDTICRAQGYAQPVGVGAAGGIGTPEAAAAAFILGADFVVTGSVNQCTVEAGTSDVVKTMLSDINVQDTAYSACGDMFEIGAKVQVLKRGVFFPARANKLHELWRSHDSLDEIDPQTRQQIQEKYFRRSFDDVYAETRAYYEKVAPQEIVKAESDPKHKMALVFRWYFIHSTRLAMGGSGEQRVDYQVHCGPALGAFNQWVKGTPLADWRNRHVDVIAEKLMTETASYLNERIAALQGLKVG